MARSELTPATAEPPARWLGRIKAVAKADQPSITVVVVSASVGLLAALAPLTELGWMTAHYGPAAMRIYFAFYVPLGWAAGVMTYMLLTPGIRGNAPRQAIINRCLIWSTLPIFLIQGIPNRYNHGFDTLFFSAWLTLIIGLELAGRTPAKLDQTLQRLRDRQVLGPPEAVDNLKKDLDRPWGVWSVIWAGLVALALLITIPRIGSIMSGLSVSEIGPVISYLLFLVAAGATAGSWIGRMITYGRLTGKRNLRKCNLEIQAILGHPDSAGGLKPLGDFHLYQSLTASLPAIFLAVWVLLISLGGPNQPWSGYQAYLDGYIILLLVAILIEILVFILPLSSIHDVMKSQKEHDFLTEADSLFPPDWQNGQAPDSQDEADQDGDRQRRIERYRELEEAPTWPIDSSIRRQFTLTNLGFLIPFLGYIVGHMQFWQQLADTFKGLG